MKKVITYIGQSLKAYYNAFVEQLKLVAHDQGLILFLLFLPLVYPILYSLIYNPELVRDVTVVVVDHDMSALSRETVRKFDATQNARVIGYATDLPEARKAVNSHKCYGILEIPSGYEKKITNGEGSQIILYGEMSLLLRYKSLLVSATDVSQAMGAELLSKNIERTVPLAETYMTGDVMGIHSVFMGNIESGFDSFIMPGVLILILHQCIILTVGMSGGVRHEYPSSLGFNPLLRRPRTLAKMLGEMTAFFLLFLLPMIWLMHYIPLLFRFPVAGDIWQELCFMTPMVLACICLGFVLQSIIWQREGIFITWVVTSLIFLFLSGLTWPRFAMPEIWLLLSDLVPATWGVEGFILMNSNGSTLSQVAPYYCNLWILTGVYFVGAYIVQRWIVRPDLKRRYIIDTGTAQDIPADDADQA